MSGTVNALAVYSGFGDVIRVVDENCPSLGRHRRCISLLLLCPGSEMLDWDG